MTFDPQILSTITGAIAAIALPATFIAGLVERRSAYPHFYVILGYTWMISMALFAASMGLNPEVMEQTPAWPLVIIGLGLALLFCALAVRTYRKYKALVASGAISR